MSESAPQHDGSRSMAANGSDPSVAARFRAAWVGDHEADPLRSVQLLPDRLARAAATVLGVDGAVICMSAAGFRVPVGTSDATARLAESLEFTAGEGPCVNSGNSDTPTTATAAGIADRWPGFAEQLFTVTPYRSVHSIPLGNRTNSLGSLDLYGAGARGLEAVAAPAAVIAAEVLTVLTTLDVDHVDPVTGELEAAWLHGPTPAHRMTSWIAVGRVVAAFDVDVADALTVLRAYAFSHSRTLDDIAHDAADGRVDLDDLGPARP